MFGYVNKYLPKYYRIRIRLNLIIRASLWYNCVEE